MEQLRRDLRELVNEEKAKVMQRFFKTGFGQYGECDVFLGLTVPQQRKIAQEASKRVCIAEIGILLGSEIHEERLVALLILVDKFRKGSGELRDLVYNFYLENTSRVNNWDLVDLTAPKIVGEYLLERNNRDVLFRLALSENLWERRIAIVSTYSFIRARQFDDTLKISKMLLEDSHDLIHKAVGWMLREIGKRDEKVLEDFLIDNYPHLPRTTLRYAIERFEEGKRLRFLRGEL
ncbi:MAG: DNA alkylation repair protein [archaeon]